MSEVSNVSANQSPNVNSSNGVGSTPPTHKSSSPASGTLPASGAVLPPELEQLIGESIANKMRSEGEKFLRRLKEINQENNPDKK